MAPKSQGVRRKKGRAPEGLNESDEGSKPKSTPDELGLTRGQKAALTRKANAEKTRQEERALQDETRTVRQAKVAAKTNAVWNQTPARKRVLSTGEGSTKVKVARGNVITYGKSKPKEQMTDITDKTTRGFTPPAINVDTDEDVEPTRSSTKRGHRSRLASHDITPPASNVGADVEPIRPSMKVTHRGRLDKAPHDITPPASNVGADVEPIRPSMTVTHRGRVDKDSDIGTANDFEPIRSSTKKMHRNQDPPVKPVHVDSEYSSSGRDADEPEEEEDEDESDEGDFEMETITKDEFLKKLPTFVDRTPPPNPTRTSKASKLPPQQPLRTAHEQPKTGRRTITFVDSEDENARVPRGEDPLQDRGDAGLPPDRFERLAVDFNGLRASSPPQPSEDELEYLTPAKPVKHSTRREIREAETPQWVDTTKDAHHRAATPHQGGTSTKRAAAPKQRVNTPAAESEDDDDALVLDGNKFKVMNQSPNIRSLIKYTINMLHASLAMDNPFPDNAECSILIKKLMRSAAKELIEELGRIFRQIYNRLRNDSQYASILAAALKDRIAIYRGHLKTACNLNVPTAYSLRTITPEELNALADVRTNLFIFPIDPATQRPKRNAPYQHPAIIEALSQFFKPRSPLALQVKFLDKFPLFNGRRCLTSSIVALAATGVYSAIINYSKSDKQKFSADALFSGYQSHMDILAGMKNANHEGFQKMMVNLYTLATSKRASGRSVDVALTYIDLDALGDE